MRLNKPLYFKNMGEWRKWLEKNHDKENEAWLVFYKKRAGKKGIVYGEALEEALCFGWIDGILKRIDSEKHAIRFTQRKNKSVWSKINKEKAEALIKSGRMADAGLAKIEEAKKSGSWYSAYTNKKRDKMPPDLKKALMKNKDALTNFQNFANSYRNMYIGWVNNAKTETTRKKRIIEVVKRSIENKKPGMN